MQTAKDAVKAAAPSAVIRTKCHNARPLRVSVSYERDGKMEKIFDVDQRQLFQKNASDRSRSIAQIREKVTAALAKDSAGEEKGNDTPPPPKSS
mmetsp:Transcript_15885/g.31351  ORF Transcript_15885/g.31351 Transcript_15885/m.31351 type:complete len:94 (-) Transcript_15885:11-292(-)